MPQSCRQCGTAFPITDDEVAVRERVAPTFDGTPYPLSPPDLCPRCRMRRRAAFRNERHLYVRTCDLCRKSMVSIFAPEKSYPVYCIECWWSDNWDAMDYGRPFDFHRPFAEQWRELFDAVPKLGLFQLPGEVNSAYTHDNTGVKNCYLTFDGEEAEDSYYGETFIKIKDCCDFLGLQRTELAYECVQCHDCFAVRFCRFCRNCSDSAFLLDCQSCRHCLGCANLSQKQYCIFNVQYAKEDYERLLRSYDLGSREGIARLRAEAERFFLTQPRKADRNMMSENVTGDDLIQCKNVFDSFDCVGLTDSRYCTHTYGASDCVDVDGWGNDLALAYDSVYVGNGAQKIAACFYVGLGATDTYHSAFCIQNSSHLFGSVALRHKQHCILNAQYSKEEYERLMPRIIGHLRDTGEWGQFFDAEVSAFAYNESVAQDWFPLTEEQAAAGGWSWREERDDIPSTEGIIDAGHLPDTIADASDDVLRRPIRCEASGRPFLIQQPELAFYRRLDLPLPRRRFDIRHRERRDFLNPRTLWSRRCAQCDREIQTSYAPDRPEIVHCEDCYRQAVY